MNHFKKLYLISILALLTSCQGKAATVTTNLTKVPSTFATTTKVTEKNTTNHQTTSQAIATLTTKLTADDKETTNPSTSTSASFDALTAIDGSNEKIAFSHTKGTLSHVYYQLAGENEVEIDKELISENSVYIPGLKAGNYSIRVIDETNTSYTINNVVVTAIDRSGYAHFKNTNGVGAYDDEGTLRSDAVVVYISDATKNTVSAKIGKKTYTGLVNILNHSSDRSVPVNVRFLDTIKTNQFKSKSVARGKRPYDDANYFVNEKETTYTELNGLSSKIWAPATAKSLESQIKAGGVTDIAWVSKSGDTDSAFNNCSVVGVKNTTIEGIGSNAGLLNWGFTFKSCPGVEVRNLTFSDYTEDACSFEGGSGEVNSDLSVKAELDTASSGFFMHHNRFNRGKNNWDLSEEQDKHDGDGSADLKKLTNVTFAYNYFYNCHKTGLLGGGDSQLTRNVTFHHNLYEKVQSRLPLGRQANFHAYNNYYLNCTTCQDMRANSFTFSEANYFEKCGYPHKVTTSTTYTGTLIKSYGDTFDQCKNASKAKIATSRTQSYKGNCKPDGHTDYTNFDTNPALFYYNTTSQKTDAAILETASQAKATCKAQSGVFKF